MKGGGKEGNKDLQSLKKESETESRDKKNINYISTLRMSVAFLIITILFHADNSL